MDAALRVVTASGCMGVSSAEAAVLCADMSGNNALESAAVDRDITCSGHVLVRAT